MFYYLKENSEAELTIKKSRFLSFLYYLTSQEEISLLLNKLRERYPKADHYCYAWLFADNYYQKYSDDGEPAKTAGLPILDVLQKSNLDNCLAVVIRYYGGIKLGAGGLNRAYRQAILLALKKADLIPLADVWLYRVIVDYPLAGALERLLSSNAYLTESSFKEKAEFTFYSFDDTLLDQINALSDRIITTPLRKIKVSKP